MKYEFEICEHCMYSTHVGELFQCELRDNEVVDAKKHMILSKEVLKTELNGKCMKKEF